MTRLVRRLLHGAVNILQALRRTLWFVTRPNTRGAHAIAFTPDGKIVLVTLSYARGWRLPGGGIDPGETAGQAVLRELKEEIGMTGHGAVEQVTVFTDRPDRRRDCSTLFIVRDVAYDPKWTLEVKAVRAFDPAALPGDMAAITRRLLEAAGVL